MIFSMETSLNRILITPFNRISFIPFTRGSGHQRVPAMAMAGKSTINGVEKNDCRENLAWALSFGFPITRQLGAKVVYLSTRSQESIGQDTDSIAAAFSIFW
jgi:hypothetical protein